MNTIILIYKDIYSMKQVFHASEQIKITYTNHEQHCIQTMLRLPFLGKAQQCFNYLCFLFGLSILLVSILLLSYFKISYSSVILFNWFSEHCSCNLEKKGGNQIRLSIELDKLVESSCYPNLYLTIKAIWDKYDLTWLYFNKPSAMIIYYAIK